VTLLCGPRGRSAAELLPGVDEVVEFLTPWIDPEPPPVDPVRIHELVADLAGRKFDEALVLTSFHQSPLATALVLRLAGIPRIGAISVDYPGALLDVRHRIDDDVHEVERGLSLAAACGYRLPHGDDAQLAVRRAAENPVPLTFSPYLVVHPGASAPARAWSPKRYAGLVDALRRRGRRVVVTGGPDESALTAFVAGPSRPEILELGGGTSFAELAEVLAGADALIVGNTGPAHLAAAVGTPVVSLYAPVVPACRWHPWLVPHVVLGDQEAACRDSRARVCPVPGHPCLDNVTADDVLVALEHLGVLHEEEAVVA
jgi:ADP-heptose:LPS heptosyltransferase